DPGGRVRLRPHLRRAQPGRRSPLHGRGSTGEARVTRRRDKGAAVASLIVLAAVTAAAILAPMLSPADPLRNDLLERLTPPMWSAGGSAAHPLGTDTLGRDVLSRLLYGARVSLVVGFVTVIISGAAGVALGVLGGFYGGWLDDGVLPLGAGRC